MKTSKKIAAKQAIDILLRSDAWRLILEGVERLGDRVRGLERREVIMLLRTVIELGVVALSQREHTLCFATVGKMSIESRRFQRPSTLRDLNYFLRRILRIHGVGEMPLRAMTTAYCRRILQDTFGYSVSMYIKARAVLSSIFSYGVKHELCDENPIARIDVPKVKEKWKEPLTLEEVKRLLDTAELPEHSAMRFSLRLMLFSGVRPMEVCRIRANDVFWDEKQVIIRATTSKTGGGRIVRMRGVDSLSREECKIPRDWLRRWRVLRLAAGFESDWVPDVCRHTFASYYAAYFCNLERLQLEMGHRDLSLLRSRYVVPILSLDAQNFWKLANL